MSTTRKSALVTGASTGLGRCIANLLAQRGYELTIVGRDAAKLESSLRHLPGSQHSALALDLSMPKGTDALAHLVDKERFRIFVNNAGATQFGALTSLSDEMIEQYLRLNLVTPAILSRAFLTRATPGDVLVNVTSIVGTIPVPGNALYSAAKSGLQSLTECLWYEMKQKGVRVIDFRPVSIKTDFHSTSGGPSMSSTGAALTPEAVALDLVLAIENGREFICANGRLALALECLRRILPKKFLIEMMGRRSEKAKYI